MSNVLLLSSLFILVLALSLFSLWLASKYRIILNERALASLSKIDAERVGSTKRYFVHMVWRKRDYTYAMCAIIIIGNLFMLAIPMVRYLENLSEEVMTIFTLFMTSISLIIALGIPFSLASYASKKSSEVLVVVDDGIEKWKVKKKKVRMLRKIEWSDITKFRVYNTSSWGVFAIYLYIGKKWVMVREDEVNVLQFLEDLQKYIPDVIRKSGPIGQNPLKVVLKGLRERPWHERAGCNESAEIRTEER